MDILDHPRRLSNPRDDFRSDAEGMAGAFGPALGLFISPRSPKGPRPAPSTFNVHSVEPARVPLPVDVEESIFFSDGRNASSPPSNGPNLLDASHDATYEPARNVQELLATSLFAGTASTSPPPFARASRTTSLTSASSPSRPYFPNAYDAPTAPDPWVAQTTLHSHDLIAPESDLIKSAMLVQSKERPAVIGSTLKRGFPNSDGPDLAARLHRAPEDSLSRKDIKEDILSTSIYQPSVKKDEANQTEYGLTNPPSNLTNDLAEAVDSLSLVNGLGTEGEDTNTDAHPKSKNIPKVIPPMQSVHEPKHRTAPMLIPPALKKNNASINKLLLTPTPPTIQSLSPSPMQNVVGSYGTSSMLAESTTWEKVEGINDEWTELPNPKEDVLVIEESEDSDEEDMDDEEWEDSRNMKKLAESGFVPSVERRRRMAQQQSATPKGNGNLTPRDGRTPSPSHGQTRGHVSEYQRLITHAPTSSRQPAAIPSPKLTPRQEQLVAELQKARSTRSTGTVGAIGSPYPRSHEQPNRKVLFTGSS